MERPAQQVAGADLAVENPFEAGLAFAALQVKFGDIAPAARRLKKSAGKLKDLDDDDDITFIPKLPKEVKRIPKVKLRRDKIYSTLRLTLGVRPVSAEVALLPLWTLKVTHKNKKKRRSIIMDAATGRTLAGYFRLPRSSKKR